MFITRELNPVLHDAVSSVVNTLLKSNRDIDRVSKINWELNIIKDDSVVNAAVFEVDIFVALLFFYLKTILKDLIEFRREKSTFLRVYSTQSRA